MGIEYTHMIMNLVLVLFLVFILVFALKKMRFTRVAKNNQIAIINTVSIGAKERVILLEVNNTTILIGATPTHVETLYVFKQASVNEVVTDDYLDEMKNFSQTLANQKNMTET